MTGKPSLVDEVVDSVMSTVFPSSLGGQQTALRAQVECAVAKVLNKPVHVELPVFSQDEISRRACTCRHVTGTESSCPVHGITRTDALTLTLEHHVCRLCGDSCNGCGKPAYQCDWLISHEHVERRTRRT